MGAPQQAQQRKGRGGRFGRHGRRFGQPLALRRRRRRGHGRRCCGRSSSLRLGSAHYLASREWPQSRLRLCACRAGGRARSRQQRQRRQRVCESRPCARHGAFKPRERGRRTPGNPCTPGRLPLERMPPLVAVAVGQHRLRCAHGGARTEGGSGGAGGGGDSADDGGGSNGSNSKRSKHRRVRKGHEGEIPLQKAE